MLSLTAESYPSSHSLAASTELSIIEFTRARGIITFACCFLCFHAALLLPYLLNLPTFPFWGRESIQFLFLEDIFQDVCICGSCWFRVSFSLSYRSTHSSAQPFVLAAVHLYGLGDLSAHLFAISIHLTDSSELWSVLASQFVSMEFILSSRYISQLETENCRKLIPEL